MAVVATVAMTAIIAWLSTNMPSIGDMGGEYDTGPEASASAPNEPYHNGHNHTGADEHPEPDNTQNTTPHNEYEYPPHDDYPADNEHAFTPVFTSEPLPEYIVDLITGVTFHDTTPFGYDYLTYLTVTHVNFYGESMLGHLIVAAHIGYEVLDIFREIYEGRFPIHSIKLIDHFGASDYYSMAANNSHAFNFRYIAGTTTISRHGFGVAIDINPVQNPYIRGDTIWPAAGAEYLDRSYVRPGMIVPGDVVYNAFVSRGWTWGGHWTWPRDYHHFERR